MKPNRKHIKFIKAVQGSPEWLALRANGIGGSEIGAVLGIADYSDPIKVYLEKIGEAEGFKGNRFTRFGKILEDLIARLYRHWDPENPSAEQMLINEEEKRIFRKVSRVNGYIVNENYPWLFASLDRRIRGDARGRGHLETKNTTGMEKNRYTYGFNQSFYCQVQHYLMLDEADFADVAIYFDGNNYDVRPVAPDKDVQQLIVTKSKEFWDNVLEARKIKEENGITSYVGTHMDFIPEEKRAAVGKLMALEPDLTGTENEYKFLQTLVKPTPEFTEMKGTDGQHALIMQYIDHLKAGKEAKRLQTAVKEKIVLSLGGYHQASFGPKEYVSYKPTAKGNRFRVSPEMMPEGIVEE